MFQTNQSTKELIIVKHKLFISYISLRRHVFSQCGLLQANNIKSHTALNTTVLPDINRYCIKFVVISMNMWLKVPSSVILLYFGVAEEYSSMQSVERSFFSLVYASSCLSVFLEFPVNIYYAAADVSLL